MSILISKQVNGFPGTVEVITTTLPANSSNILLDGTDVPFVTWMCAIEDANNNREQFLVNAVLLNNVVSFNRFSRLGFRFDVTYNVVQGTKNIELIGSNNEPFDLTVKLVRLVPDE